MKLVYNVQKYHTFIACKHSLCLLGKKKHKIMMCSHMVKIRICLIYCSVWSSNRNQAGKVVLGRFPFSQAKWTHPSAHSSLSQKLFPPAQVIYSTREMHLEHCGQISVSLPNTFYLDFYLHLCIKLKQKPKWSL